MTQIKASKGFVSPPANWPFPTWKGRPLPKPKRQRKQAKEWPDAPF